MSIEIKNINKTFDRFRALKDVNLLVKTGELVALLGPSGSGKTTLLRIIAGLERQDSGSVIFDGKDTTDVHVRHRKVGFVFQHYALFRHMTVFENVAFGLRVRPRASRPSSDEIGERVHKLLKLVQLEFMATRYPSQLSGGQRQRVALARALAVEPQILLLDEPFGALDAKVRKELRAWVRRLHDEINMTSVFVTHDQEEAMELADRVVVMNEGCVVQIGTPEEVYKNPATPFVYNFLGNVNLFSGRIVDGKVFIGEAAPVTDPVKGECAQVYIRPHLLDLAYTSDGRSHLKARIQRINAAGSMVKIELLNGSETPIQVELSQERYSALGIKPGEEVFVIPKEMKVFTGDFQI